MAEIDTPVLRQLLRSGRCGPIRARGVPGGFVVEIVSEGGLENDVLASQRGAVRRFRTLDAVANYLNGLGAPRFEVVMESWSRQSLSI